MTGRAGSEFFFDTLDLMESPGATYWFAVLADVGVGAPDPATAVIQSLMLDGDNVEWLRDGNMQFTFRVAVRATSVDQLLLGARELASRTRRATTIRVTLPHSTVQSFYDVLTSSVSLSFDDLLVSQAHPFYEQVYAVTATCVPGARLSDATVTTVSMATASGVSSCYLGTFPVGGSVRAGGSVHMQAVHPLSTPLSGMLIYTDPTMTTHGWSPGDSTSWAAAPGGRYAAYVKTGALGGSMSAGDTITTTMTGPLGGLYGPSQVETTVWDPDANPTDYTPAAIFYLPSGRDGLVGPVFFDAYTMPAGGGSSTSVDLTDQLLLFRISDRVGEETCLVTFDGIGATLPAGGNSNPSDLYIDAPSVDNDQRAGVYVDDLASSGRSITHALRAWGIPRFSPGTGAIWATRAGHANVTVEVSIYERHDGFVSA